MFDETGFNKTEQTIVTDVEQPVGVQVHTSVPTEMGQSEATQSGTNDVPSQADVEGGGDHPTHQETTAVIEHHSGRGPSE